MQGFNPSNNVQWENNFAATPVSAGGQTATSGAIDTKGAYLQLIASTLYDSFGFWLQITSTQTAATIRNVLMDLAVGAAASESIILPDFQIGSRGTGANFGSGGLFIPLFIPKNSRVSVRIASNVNATTAAICIALVEGQNEAGSMIGIFSKCDAYGVIVTGSKGTNHTPGNTGAESADATIGTATRAYGACIAMVGNNQTVLSALYYHWELRISSFTRAEWRWSATTAEELFGPFPPAPITMNIANGEVMQVRAECSGTAEAHNVALYCFY